MAVLMVSPVWAGEREPVKPSAKDRCAVCGMFPAKHSNFATQILFKDGSYAVFDGVKDMFKYYLNLKKYNPSKTLSDIVAIYVTDYYDVVMVDAYNASYVAGSNVYGPMGKDLMAFEKEEAAKEFMIDHRGKSLLRFNEVTHHLIKRLDGHSGHDH
jgi:nitrous oxide reductase accessory protein NosL